MANGEKIPIRFKLTNVAVCFDKGCFITNFVISKSITQLVILGTPFLTLLYPFSVSQEGIVSRAKGRKNNLRFITAPQPSKMNIL